MDLHKAEKWLRVSDYLPRRYPLRRNDANLSAQPYFIVGSGRNGSTMFSAMLDSHPDLLLPTEQWRFPNIILKYKLYNYLPWKELVSILIGEIAATNASLNWNVNFNDTLAHLQYLEPGKRTLQEIINRIYLAYGNENHRNFKRWGEKSPKNMPFTPLIHQVFPKASYIFLIRDGRDVARSWLIKNESKDLKWIAESWNQSIEMYQWLQKVLPPDQLLMVKYEDLVAETEKSLTKVGDFLEVGYHPNMTSFQSFAERIDDRYIKHFEKLKTKANTSSIGKWEEYFKDRERDKIHLIIGKNLKAFGYD